MVITNFSFTLLKLTREKQGELIIISGTILWSLFPIVTISIYKYISPLFTLAYGTFFATLFFGIILLFKNNWKEFKNKTGIIYILKGSFLLAIMWALIFIALKYTTAGNASIMMLMEILFSFLFFGIWQKEKYHYLHILGAITMGVGALIILFPGSLKINKGDFIIFFAMLLPPLANSFQQKARKLLSVETLLFVRNLFTTPFFFGLAFLSRENIPTLQDFQATLPLFLFSGFFLFGICKIMWIEGIHRISVTKAVSFETISPAFTLIFAYFLLNEIPTFWQILGFIPILIGGILITRKPNLKINYNKEKKKIKLTTKKIILDKNICK